MDGKLTKTEKFLLAVTAVFFAALALLYLTTLKTAPGTDYTITTQRQMEAPPEDMVNVNTASREELEALNGIGPSLAQRIIDHRDANGPFESVEDLLEVSGIGEATLEKFRNHVILH